MPDVAYMLFDTAVFGAAAPTEFILFQSRQGSDGTHTETFTNSRGPGVMPQSESFKIEVVYVWPDFAPLEANVGTWFLASKLEVILADKLLLSLPLTVCLGQNRWGGADASTAAANQAHVSMDNGGFELLDHPITLPPGEVFKVRLLQGTAAAASSNVKVGLQGILTLP
jgi:hypothetical protein